MGRLVRVPKVVQADMSIAGMLEGMLQGGAPGQHQPPTMVIADSYLERLGKYVPAEMIAFTIFINAILEQAIRAGGKSAAMGGLPITTVGAVALIAAMAMTPIYVWYVREDGDAWIMNAVMSTLAFPFWAYALGAVAFDNVFDGNLAAILLVSFTLFSGLVAPLVPRPKKAAKAATPPVEMPRLVEPLAS
jgi:hypothetical protein